MRVARVSRERWSMSLATLHECFWGHRHRQSGACTHLHHFTPQTGQGRLQLGVPCLYFIHPLLQGKGEGWDVGVLRVAPTKLCINYHPPIS